MFTLGDFLASVGTLGAALGWIEYRFREVTRDMNTLRTEVDKDREDALNKERDERLRQITNLTAEHQQATARIERRFARLSRFKMPLPLAALAAFALFIGACSTDSGNPSSAGSGGASVGGSSAMQVPSAGAPSGLGGRSGTPGGSGGSGGGNGAACAPAPRRR